MSIARRLSSLTGWQAAIVWGLATMLALRLVLGVVMGAAWLSLRPYLIASTNTREYQGLLNNTSPLYEAAFGVWLRWDAIHHLNLARQWYDHLSEAESVYYPLYAFLVRLVAPILGSDYVISGLVISSLCAWAAFACLYSLSNNFYDPQAAKWSLLSLAAYPTAIFLVAPFTESCYLALTLASFLSAYRQRWWLAGGFGFLASLARGPGMFTAASLLVIAWSQWRSRPERISWQSLSIPTGILLPLLGGLAFISWRALAGYPSIQEITYQYSGLALVNPVRGFYSAIRQWVQVRDLPTTLDTLSACGFIAITVSMWLNPRWRKAEWLVYMTANLLTFLSKESYTASSLQSMSRYVLALFPAYLAIGDCLAHQSDRSRFIYLTTSSVLLILLSIFYMLWLFIG